ncbi:MAG: PAS domain-containing protein [Flavobacteriales bacterium]|nr:PAS domain-containing protein [Flavobacteriales bacterium]
MHYLERELNELIQKDSSVFRFIQSFALDGVWYLNLQNPEDEYMDARFWQLLGFNPEDKEHRSSEWQSLIFPEDLEIAKEDLAKHIQDPTHPHDLVVRYYTATSEVKQIRARGIAIRDENGVPIRVLGVHQDLSPVVKLENESRENIMIFIEEAPTSIAMFDSDMRYLAASKQWYTDYHIPFENIVGMSHYDVFPEIGEVWKQDHRDVLNGATVKMDEDLFIREDGSRQWLSYELKPWRKKNGEIGGIIMFTADISHLKKTSDKLEMALEKSDKQNDRLQNFAHIVSHNLRSHSGNISMLLELLEADYPELMKNEYVQMISKANENLSTTLPHLNEVTQINRLLGQTLTRVNLRDFTQKAINTLAGEANVHGVSIENNIEKGIEVDVVPAYLDSILLNLISNGIKYRDDEKESFVRINNSLEGNSLILTVEDNGIGLDAVRHQHKLFGLYKTFHGNSDATGVGLFMTKNQVEAMDGSIELTSELGMGTIISIRWPYEQKD